MMSATKIAKIILTKDTCYGSFDAKSPTNDELAEYFGQYFIEEYAKEYHKAQTIIDAEAKKIAEEKKINWWNED